jgi:lysophospholipase L1-like esterase
VHCGIALAFFMANTVAFIALEGISAAPANEARSFLYFIRHNLSPKRSPVLVCLGDSLTHGTVSHSYTVDVPTQVAATLAKEPPKANSLFADPLWVVNCGQNFITTHTIWRERLTKALDCHPDYIFLLIGTNDMLGIYTPQYGKFIQNINELPEALSMATFTRNFHGILQHIAQASPMTQVGVATLPPLGEDMRSAPNKLIREANAIIEQACQQAGDKFTVIPLFDRFESILEKEGRRGRGSSIVAFAVNGFLYALFKGMIKLNTLGKVWGNSLLHDGIHMNERAAEECVDLIVDWLVSKGLAKAIAVKGL